MQRLEVSGTVRPIYGSLGVKWLNSACVEDRVMIICISVCPFVFGLVPLGEIPRNPLKRRVGL